MKEIHAQTWNNAKALHKNVETSLLNKDMFSYFELLFYLVLDKTLQITLHKECKTSESYKIYKKYIAKNAAELQNCP